MRLDTRNVAEDTVVNREQDEDSETHTVRVDTIVNKKQSDELQTETMEKTKL